MEELFQRLLSGQAPLLVDLPTGSGKTDLAVIWLIALAYYGLNQSAQPVPRRLVWVVNRKVLVGQIYRLAQEMLTLISNADEIRNGLLALSPANSNQEPLNIVQLRGQVVADREWSFSPACPALIIGTVDQLGSRLLFQGYGLGKRERPMQAGLFGVDAWVCVDEAHLVPAFILTMRQLKSRITAGMAAECPAALQDLFSKLPWYFTELSATPGLPAPAEADQLTLSKADEDHPVLAMRIAAGNSKRIAQVDCSDAELVEKMAAQALSIQHQQQRVAIYVRKPDTARKIKTLIEKGLPGTHPRYHWSDAGRRARGTQRQLRFQSSQHGI
jgi:CRISPR-associated endonuclease/helicase Cas3